MRRLVDYPWNRTVGWRRPGAKIFFIGFNKCGTTAIDRFLRVQGVRSVHWEVGGENLALEIEKRIGSDEELARYLSRWTAYSDLIYSSDEETIEGNRHFRKYHELFPDAYFVLNDRDPQRWVASRLAHGSGRFTRRCTKILGCSEEELGEIWLRDREKHYEAVFSHFSASDRFLHFRIDRDDIQTLIDFLSPDFRLDGKHWRPANVTRRT